jgi:hypothetical protein
LNWDNKEIDDATIEKRQHAADCQHHTCVTSAQELFFDARA